MKFGSKILISFLLIFGLALYYITHDFLSDIRFRYLEGVEDTLVDQSRILASLISDEIRQKRKPTKKLQHLFNRVYQTTFSARIYELNKTSVDTRVYITDNKGILVFDSKNIDIPGTDYSQWRDVYLTLKGEYGARSTKECPSKNPGFNAPELLKNEYTSHKIREEIKRIRASSQKLEIIKF